MLSIPWSYWSSLLSSGCIFTGSSCNCTRHSLSLPSGERRIDSKKKKCTRLEMYSRVTHFHQQWAHVVVVHDSLVLQIHDGRSEYAGLTTYLGCCCFIVSYVPGNYRYTITTGTPETCRNYDPSLVPTS